jgi:predicted RNase H-like nuclease (RuvC/YqgF family)
MSKKGKGKGKKKGDKGGDELEKLQGQVHLLMAQTEILQKQLIIETEKADHAKSSENEERTRLMELNRCFKEEEETRFDIISDMTRQYKSMQQELQKENSDLKKLVKEQDLTIEQKEQEITNITREKDMELLKKDDEIRDLRRKIEEMSSDFARMLKETLEKMQQRIDLAHWDSDHDPQIVKQLKEVNS